MRYALVIMLAVMAVVVSGCATAPSSGVNYHYGAHLPLVPAPVVVVETPPQPREVWIETSRGSVQAWQQGGQTYIVDGLGQTIPVPSGVGLDIVYTNPGDIRVMRQEDRADFHSMLRADQQNHNQSMNWARYRLQRDQQEHRQEMEERRQDLREQEQVIETLEDLNRMRNQNVLLGTNTIPTQVQDRRIQQQEVKIPATVIRTSEERSVRMTTPSVSRPLATERRVERAEVAEQRKSVVVPPKKRTSAPVVTCERVVTPRQSASVNSQRVVRPEAGSQPRTRGER